MLQAIKDWLYGLWSWLRMMTPRGRARLLERARKAGWDEGIEATCRQLANLNRQQRRRTVREIVSEYKDPDKRPE